MTEILVVDDEPLVLLTLRSLCDWPQYGMHIAGEAENGKVALDFLSAHPEIDIVITDVDMPVMDGLALSEALKDLPEPPGVIFLSAYSNFEYVRRAFKSGASDYILKTELDEEKLVALIRKGVSRAAGSGDAVVASENLRANLFRDMTEGAVADMASRFSECAFAVSFPFYFMILRPGDMPLVRSRYEGNLYAFQKTVSDLVGHFASAAGGDSGAVSFDLYYVFMDSLEKMDKVFDQLYESAWSYLDIGFERKSGNAILAPEGLQEELVSCMRDFAPPSRIVVRTRRYIRDHFSEPSLSLSDIAEYTEVSKNHLSWEYAHETGETVSDYIARTRIHAAKKLLLETNLRTYEIADKTGYLNVETFCRAFKKLTGTSPRQFS